ncbi:MAG: hypothetical protein RSG52_10225 [Terrisporobacter sp.]|uniref:hypothetical protein n=1 Tax=Clostridia TaxID=186801 RepID=UPI002FC6E3EB
MEIWKEYEKDAFNYFEYFNSCQSILHDNELPNMSVISYNALIKNGINDINKFILESSKILNNLYNKNSNLKNYKFYLLVNREMENQNSKVENYLKIWRQIRKKYDIEKFNLGVEVKSKLNNTILFSSIAEVPIDFLHKAIEIVRSCPRMYTLFMSKREDIMTVEQIENMVEVLLSNNDFVEINYFRLCQMCCNRGDIAIRYGTSFEDHEIALIYNPTKINIDS